MTKKGAGFFGSLWNGIKSIAAPLLGNVGKVVSGLFGGAKKKAVQVAHQAINTVAQGAQQALKTGDVKGAAKQSYSAIKNDAMSTARQQYGNARDTMRREASRGIDSAHRNFNQRAQSHYSDWRSHPRFEQPSYRRDYGPPPPRSYNRYYGAGFGKKHFDKIKKSAHKHINKIHAESMKHLKAAFPAIKKNGKKGGAAAKRAHTKHMAAVHKAARAGYLKDVKAIKASLHADIKKKGGGMSVGAGARVGAGTKVGAGFRQMTDAPKRVANYAGNYSFKQNKAAEKEGYRDAAHKKRWAGKKTKKGSGMSVGAGVKRKKKRRVRADDEEY